MKLICALILLTLSGCASSSTKASRYCDQNWMGRCDTWRYCDQNWMGRYDTWLQCYENELPNQNKGLK
jgi:hypothetical protein